MPPPVWGGGIINLADAMLNVLSEQHIVYNMSALLESGETVLLAMPSSLLTLPSAPPAGSLAGALKLYAPQKFVSFPF